MPFLRKIYLLDATNRNHSIEGLRGLSVLMVFNVHFFSLYYTNAYFIGDNNFLLSTFRMLHAGHIGVDIFFVISGYFIWKILFVNKVPYGKYLKNRIERLTPAYFLNTLILAFPIFEIVKIFQNLFFLPQFFDDTKGYYNFVSWTLAWEWIFYILILFVAFVTNRNKRNAAIIITSLMIGLFLFSIHLFGEQGLLSTSNILRFMGFAVGCFLADQQFKFKGKSFFYMGTLSLPFIFLASFLWGNFYEIVNYTSIRSGLFYLFVSIMTFYLLNYLLNFESKLRRFFEMEWLRAIGQISYTFYLTHGFLTIKLSEKIISVDSFPSMAFSYLLTFVICVIVSTFLFYITERLYLSKKTQQTIPQQVINNTSAQQI